MHLLDITLAMALVAFQLLIAQSVLIIFSLAFKNFMTLVSFLLVDERISFNVVEGRIVISVNMVGVDVFIRLIFAPVILILIVLIPFMLLLWLLLIGCSLLVCVV